MKRLRIVMVLTTLLLAAVAPATALAETVGRRPVYDVTQAVVGFSFSDQDGTWTGGMYVVEERIARTLELGFFFSGEGGLRTCDNGTPEPDDDYEVADYVEFSAYLPDDEITIERLHIARNLSRAVLEVALQGQRITYDYCADPVVVSVVAEAHRFSVQLTPDGDLQETVLVECGNGVEEITTIREVSASGQAVLDGRSATVDGAQLARVIGSYGAAC